MYAVVNKANTYYSPSSVRDYRRDSIKSFFGSQKEYEKLKKYGWKVKKVKVTIEEL
jgi:hypothetical protein